MATLDQDKKQEISDLLAAASTWTNGNRSLKLLAASKVILGEDQETADQLALEELGKTYRVPQEKSTGAKPVSGEEPAQEETSDPQQEQAQLESARIQQEYDAPDHEDDGDF